MALINNLYVFVEDEQITREIASTTHPVEVGTELTDSVRSKPLIISLKGKIVNHGNVKASEILSKLCDLQKKGSLITFKGRNTANNLQIQSFNSSHPNTVWGGLEFNMELKEVRIAKKAYVAPKTTKTVKPAKTAKKTTIKVGSIVVFKGGSVYASSDAAKAAATRGRSTCKCTIISNASYSVHKYHLISTDGKMVYGWVDGADIEGVTGQEAIRTTPVTNGGTQQISKSDDVSVKTHTVKKGDDWNTLANVTYKNEIEKTISTRESVMSSSGYTPTIHTSSSGETHSGGGRSFNNIQTLQNMQGKNTFELVAGYKIIYEKPTTSELSAYRGLRGG